MKLAPDGLRSALVLVLLLAAALLAWQGGVALWDISPRVLPSPGRVAAQGWAGRDALASNALATLRITALGFALSLIIAWAIAVAVDFAPLLRRAVVLLLVISQTIPIVALAPLMIIWFGFGTLPKVLLIALATFFPVCIGLIEGFAAADGEAGKLLRSMGAGRGAEFLRLRLPAALPRFFTALRIGVTYAVVAAVFSEYVGASEGLGIYMLTAKNSFRTDLVLAAVAVISVISMALVALTYLAERLVVPWAAAERANAGWGGNV